MSHPKTRSDVHRRGTAFWVGVVIGWAVMAWGLRGIFRHHIDTRPGLLAFFFIRGALVHDLLLVPVVLLIGVAIGRVAPARWRAGVQTALLVCGVLALFAYPEVRGYAHILHNPTSLPYNYTANLAVVVGSVVAMAITVVVVRRFRTKANHSPPDAGRASRNQGPAGSGRASG